MAIKEIVRRTGHSRGLVRQILRGQRGDVFRVRKSSLESHLPWLDTQWAAGHHNATELWRRLKTQGFHGSVRVVTEWATRRRRADWVNVENLRRVPSARTIARLKTTSRDTLSKAETVTVAAVEAGVPLLIEAREIIAAFHVMIRRKAKADLNPWIECGRASLVASFANGVDRDIAAVRAATVSSWSNRQTEGQITKLKLVKRQMYGRGKLDLLARGSAYWCNLMHTSSKPRQSPVLALTHICCCCGRGSRWFVGGSADAAWFPALKPRAERFCGRCGAGFGGPGANPASISPAVGNLPWLRRA